MLPERFDKIDIAIPKGVRIVGHRLFKLFKTLEEINIPEGVEVIEEEGFFGCEALKKVILPNTLHRIGKGAFAVCDSFEYINLPVGLQQIEAYAFMGCKKLRCIIIPKTCEVIGRSAFVGCNNLEYIILLNPNLEVTDIGLTNKCVIVRDNKEDDKAGGKCEFIQ